MMMRIMNHIKECDFVIGIKRGKIIVIKDREGTSATAFELNISFSELFTRLLNAMNNENLSDALTPLVEKIRIYETFQ